MDYSNRTQTGKFALRPWTDATVIAKAQQLKPDIIVLDFFMPGMTGVEAARVLDRVLPSVPILLFTFEVTSQLIDDAKNVGIKGVVQKSDTREITNGVEALLRKATFFTGKWENRSF